MNQYRLPVVFVVLVLRDAAVVHDVEQSRETDGHLNERSHPTVLGETVLVVPAPVSPEDKINKNFYKDTSPIMMMTLPGQSPPVSNGVVELTASKPGRQLVHLHLKIIGKSKGEKNN